MHADGCGWLEVGRRAVGVATVLLISLNTARAQGVSTSYRNRVTDSLWADLNNPARPDSQRVLTLFSLEEEYYTNDNAASLRVARQALAEARRQKFQRGELMLLNALAYTTAATQNLPQAERWAQELQRHAWAAPPPLRRFRIVALQALAHVATQQGNVPRALAYLRQTLPLMGLVANKPTSDFPLVTSHSLSDLYTQLVVQAPAPAPDSLVQQAFYHTRRTAALARAYVRRFAHEPGGPDRRDLIAASYTQLAQLSDATSGDSATYYFDQGARLYHILRYGSNESKTYTQWAISALRHNQLHTARQLASKGLALAQIYHLPAEEVAARKTLAQALATLGWPSAAYQQVWRATRLDDSLQQVRNYTYLQTLQVQFDTQRQENQIRDLTQQQAAEQERSKRQRSQLWLLGLGLTIVGLAGGAVSGLALRLRRSRALLAAQNEELTRTRAAQDRLYALVAHDLRSPVVAFTGLAKLLHRYAQNQDTVRLASLGDRMQQAARNLSELLDSLLNWAMSQRGELVPTLRPLCVADLLAELTDLYHNVAEAADVVLTAEAPADLMVVADSDMIRTILRNLTGNALKVTPSGGRVALQARPGPEGVVVLELTDSGPGLTPEVLHQFGQEAGVQPFRVASQGRGAGLGLLLSRTFAQVQGGSLVLTNLANGAGTVAKLQLPAASPSFLI